MENLNNIYDMYSQKENIQIRIKSLGKIIQRLENGEDAEKKVLSGIIENLYKELDIILTHLKVYGLEQLNEKEYFDYYKKVNAQIERLKSVPDIISWVHNGFFDLGKEGISDWMIDLDSIDLNVSGAWSGKFTSNKEEYQPGYFSFVLVKNKQKIAGRGVVFDSIFLDALIEGIADDNEIMFHVFHKLPPTKSLLRGQLASIEGVSTVNGIYDTQDGWDKGIFIAEKKLSKLTFPNKILKVSVINECRNCIEEADLSGLKTKLRILKETYPNQESEISKFIFEISDHQSSEIKYGLKDNVNINYIFQRLLNYLSNLKRSSE